MKRMVLVAAYAVAGCSNTSRVYLRAPEPVPHLVVDESASEVEVTGSADAERIRHLATQTIGEMVVYKDGVDIPARYRLRFEARSSTNIGAMFYCFIPMLPIFWTGTTFYTCPLTTFEATAHLRLETKTGTFQGTGRATHSLCGNPNYCDADVVWSACVHDAIAIALANARVAEGDDK